MLLPATEAEVPILPERGTAGKGSIRTHPAVAIRNATARTMRQANRSLVLNLIREHAPISRPGLATLSGMHRSNVTLIADELVADGLVEEARGVAQGRGRVPELLSLSGHKPAVLGISVRPAQVTGLLARLDGTTETVFRFPTPSAPEHLIDLLREHCMGDRATRSRIVAPVEQVVLAVPGRVLPDQGLWMPDFPRYAHFNLAEAANRLLRKPVALVNGGNVAALAAMRLERENRTDNLAFVAVHDEGVGGGIITQRRLYCGHDGTFAGEFGHMVVTGEGPRCACGNVGCWGELLSNRAVWTRLAQAGALGRDRKRPFDAAAYRAFLQEASGRDDHPHRDLLRPVIRVLANGLRNINNVLNPREIIVAGVITDSWKLLQEELAANPSFPDVSRKLTPARIPLAELYEVGTVQHGLEEIFASAPV